jgi:hypothetical protein
MVSTDYQAAIDRLLTVLPETPPLRGNYYQLGS